MPFSGIDRQRADSREQPNRTAPSSTRRRSAERESGRRDSAAQVEEILKITKDGERGLCCPLRKIGCTLDPLPQSLQRRARVRGSAARGFAVGIALTGGPPHRSQRALLTHWAPTSGHDAQSLFGIRVQCSMLDDFHQPSVVDGIEESTDVRVEYPVLCQNSALLK